MQAAQLGAEENMPLCRNCSNNNFKKNLQGYNIKCVLLSCNKANNFFTIYYKYQ